LIPRSLTPLVRDWDERPDPPPVNTMHERNTFMKTGPKKILFATIGSLGDLHPCLALALELKRRGHIVTIAATPFYRTIVEQCGFAFMPLRPDWNPTSGELVSQCENIRRGPEVLLRKLILPHLQDTYGDLIVAARDADLMIAGELVYAAPLVAEKLNLRWASAILSPCTFFSVHDPPHIPTAPELALVRKAGPRFHRVMLNLSSRMIESWWRPVRALRRAEGLGPGINPLLHDKFAPGLVLALFSRCLAQPQSDWPPQTVQPGFAFYDRPQFADRAESELESFLNSGEPSVVFTQGSTAVHHPGDFYRVSIEAARRIGRRAILVGAEPSAVPEALDVLAVRYAPYSEVFPRAAVNVHQGGSGTTGQAMQAGRPMLIVPFGWDQPDNAARTVRLGVALSISRKRYSPDRAAQALQRLIADPRFAERAALVQKQMESEDGLSSACTAIEKLLSR
jgi:rhamnosyltransferase subunit B